MNLQKLHVRQGNFFLSLPRDHSVYHFLVAVTFNFSSDSSFYVKTNLPVLPRVPFLFHPPVSESIFIIAIHRPMSRCTPLPKAVWAVVSLQLLLSVLCMTLPLRCVCIFTGSLIHRTSVNPQHDIFVFLFFFSHCCYHRAGLTLDLVQTSQHSHIKTAIFLLFNVPVPPEETLSFTCW